MLPHSPANIRRDQQHGYAADLCGPADDTLVARLAKCRVFALSRIKSAASSVY
jgi:hypothetical protein